jgi:hypothetical protein
MTTSNLFNDLVDDWICFFEMRAQELIRQMNILAVRLYMPRRTSNRTAAGKRTTNLLLVVKRQRRLCPHSAA